MEWVQTVRRGAMVPLPYSDEKGRGVQEKTGGKGEKCFAAGRVTGRMGRMPLLHHGVETLGTVCGSAAKPGFRVQVREFPMRA